MREQKTIIFKRHIKLWKIAYSSKWKTNLVTIEVEVRQVIGDRRTIDLEPITSWKTLSICGNIWNAKQTDIVCGGQNIDEINELCKGKKVRLIYEIWKRWHLNDLKDGTRRQMEALKECKSNNYSVLSMALEERGIFEDNGYKYGHGSLVEIIPDEIIQEVQELFNSFEEYKGF